MNDEINSGIQPGSLISGRYKIVSALGQGAMGDVYICAHKDLEDKLFVLKVLKPEIANDEIIMKRFHNEVIAALNVSHENVVRAYEFIKEGPLVGYTMEYVRGGDLADKMMINSQLPIDLIIDYLFQMCAGTAALHKHGIIHRDLKPENILITEDNVAKISDFGISMLDKNSRMTETGALLGSTNYIAPEYIQFQKVDERTDIYALGIIAYEMVTGTDPFPGENIFLKMQQRTQVNPYDPRMYRNDCPEKLALWINKCITILPKDRFQSCIDMIDALAEIDASDVGTFSGHSSHLENNNRGTYELKNSVDEATGRNREKTFAQNYKSDVIDLTQQRANKSPYVTKTIVANRNKKSPLKSLIVSIPFFVVLIFGYLIYQKYQANQNPLPTTIPIPVNQIAEAKKEQLPNQIEIFKAVNTIFVEGLVTFSNGKIQGITFTASPPAQDATETQIRRLTFTKSLLTQQDGLDFTILGEGNFDTQTGKEVVNQRTSIRINGRKSADNNSLKISIIAPDKLDTSTLGANFGFQRISNILTPYLFAEFTIIAEELESATEAELAKELEDF